MYSYTGAMTKRRVFFSRMVAAALGAFSDVRGQQPVSTPRLLFEQDLSGPFLGWVLTATEVYYPPGVLSGRHRHSGFVLGYVLQGPYKFQVAGGEERVLETGQVFHEQLGSIHTVSGAADPKRPARILAVIVGEKGKPTTAPA